MNESERQRADERWEQRFSELERYIRILGHARISRADFANTALRTWLRTQQQMAKAGTLPTERWWRLTGLGLELLGNDERWERRFAQLRQFRERFGHCRVLAKWKEDVPFGHWVHVQRAFKKKGILSAMRIALLESVGFQWQARWPGLTREANWQGMCALLEAFAREHGHTEVSRGDAANLRLAEWVRNQREADRAGRLSAERRARLEAAGFVWKGTGRSWQQLWDERFAQLLAYRERFGHCHVPAKWKEDVPFGHWVHVQREFRRKGLLSAERIARLEAAGFQWHGPRGRCNVQRAGWAEMAARLAAWKQEHGTARVSSRPGSENLRRWVDKQRQAARNGTLRADRRERLDTIGCDWAGARADLDAHWERRFAQLLAFRERFGHCRVAAKWKEDISLGQWVHEQRSTRKKGILKAERLRRLDEIGFQWAK